MAQNKRFISEVPEALTEFPGLHYRADGDDSYLEGSIDIRDEVGSIIDTYEIRIKASPAYPSRYPLVYETGGRLPHNIDWHIYDGGHWCIGAYLEERIACTKGITLTAFINNQVKGFLFSQTYRRENGYFYQERSHGIDGIFEYYFEVLDLSTRRQVYDAMKIIVDGKEPQSNDKCFCGSNSKYHKCHRQKVRYISKYGKIAVQVDFKMLQLNT